MLAGPSLLQSHWFQVGKYQVGKTIGEGTFGKVKLAVNTETGEKMAIKVRRECVQLTVVVAGQVFADISTMGRDSTLTAFTR